MISMISALALGSPNHSPTRSFSPHYCSPSPSFSGRSTSAEIMEEKPMHPAYVSPCVLMAQSREIPHQSRRFSILHTPRKTQSGRMRRRRSQPRSSSERGSSTQYCKSWSELKVLANSLPLKVQFIFQFKKKRTIN